MTPLPFGRVIRLGSTGDDVVAVKRGLARAGHGNLKNLTQLFGKYAVENLKEFQTESKLKADGVYGAKTHAKLTGHFDALARKMYGSPQLAKARDLLVYCKTFKGGYVWGGGHGVLLSRLNPSQGFDCSGSVSLALYHVGLFPDSRAWGSWQFEQYGTAGRGKYLTVYANADHVWFAFNLPEGWYRFDTSPHGDGGQGPRVRTGPRPMTRFVVRHPKGF